MPLQQFCEPFPGIGGQNVDPADQLQGIKRIADGKNLRLGQRAGNGQERQRVRRVSPQITEDMAFESGHAACLDRPTRR
jgi:hypothetical protein